MSRTTNCRYCGHNIDVAIALHNTCTPDVCDNSAIEQMAKRRKEQEHVINMLATKVMGWEKHEVELDLTDGGTKKFFDSWRKNGKEVATHWQSLYNIADAWMIVDRFKNESDAYIRFTFESHVPPLIFAIDPAVICEAAKRTIEAIETRA